MSSKYLKRKKAEYNKSLRDGDYKQKKFNVPLRAFVEHKYPAIFKEYEELYEKMETAYPKRKGFLDCGIFTEWLQITKPVDLSSVVEETTDNDEATDDESGTNDEATNNDEATGEATDALSVALRETFDDGPVIGAVYDIVNNEENLLNEADQIIAELLEQNDIADIMNDEGIELNIEDELAFDIEPFDFNLEVDC